MTEKKISKLAISSVILSISSIFLGLSWIPGIICGHMARARIKTNPNLTGRRLALAGLITGYFFPVALIAIVLYLSGYLEQQAAIVDRGRVVWEGHFPYDAHGKDSQNRSDIVLAPVVINGKIVGNIESRDRKLRLVFNSSGPNKEITIWKYQDYSNVSKITVDEAKRTLILYHSHTLIRDKDYCTDLFLDDFRTHNTLVNRGQWRL
jgi:hypothetical protein